MSCVDRSRSVCECNGTKWRGNGPRYQGGAVYPGVSMGSPGVSVGGRYARRSEGMISTNHKAGRSGKPVSQMNGGKCDL